MKIAILLLFAALAAIAAPAHFFVLYEVTPGVDIAHLTPQQAAVFKEHGINLTKLRDAGILLTAGRMLNPQHPRAIAIFTAEDEAAAKEIAAADPAVKAGLMKVTVETLDLVFPPVAK
ncbi:MAG: YCII-related protein [Candidatus Solibacter sp.]|jgi:uncharacterized protein YciI|nr:YCII-related protein [Candidatus Solibacter sp.]